MKEASEAMERARLPKRSNVDRDTLSNLGLELGDEGPVEKKKKA